MISITSSRATPISPQAAIGSQGTNLQWPVKVTISLSIHWQQWGWIANECSPAKGVIVTLFYLWTWPASLHWRNAGPGRLGKSNAFIKGNKNFCCYQRRYSLGYKLRHRSIWITLSNSFLSILISKSFDIKEGGVKKPKWIQESFSPVWQLSTV